MTSLRARLLAALLASLLPFAAGAAGGLFSATGPVIAVLGDELYLGEATGHLSGAGTLTIHAQKNASLTCAGEFTSSASAGGSGRLQCSDGSTATFRFQRMGAFHGHGEGQTSRGPMTFAYGLTPEEAAPYLKLPAGKQLLHNGAEVAIGDL